MTIKLTATLALLLTSLAWMTTTSAQTTDSALQQSDEGLEVWFIRHAESEMNVIRGPLPEPDRGVSYPLTERGVRQAALLGASFTGVPVSHLYSSPLLRTVETAAAISQQTGVPIRLAPGVAELDFGDTPNLYDDPLLRDLMGRWVEGDDDARLDDTAESLAEARERFSEFWQNFVRSHSDDKGLAVIVSHGVLIGMLVSELCPELSAAQAMQNHLPNTGQLRARLQSDRLQCLEYSGLTLPID